jgi:tetratricopeptide (TPR) repeat protein
MNWRNPLSALHIAVLTTAFILSGCESRADRVRSAFEQYEAAMAASDLPAARKALVQLVAQEDGVSRYWLELGKSQLARAEFAAAYNSFVRAHELDRANPEILGVLTQLALRSGELQRAEEHARQLELVAPGDPAVGLTYGYAALSRDDIAGATEQVTKLLEASPYDPSAKVLMSRILLQSGKSDEAIAVLREQIRIQPSDELALRGLLAVEERQDDWRAAATTARALVKWQPRDRDLRRRLVETELRAGNVGAALEATRPGLADGDPVQLERLLAPWVATGHAAAAAVPIFDAAKSASGERRLVLARFLAAAGKPRLVITLTRDAATLPVEASNLTANALFGAALGSLSNGRSGLDRLNAALAVDPANGDALRGRASLLIMKGSNDQAVEDARRLVATHRLSADARLFMAGIYTHAGRDEDARRVLWDAFHEISPNHAIYGALKSSVARSDGAAAAERLAQEFDDQRTAAMGRSFL